MTAKIPIKEETKNRKIIELPLTRKLPTVVGINLELHEVLSLSLKTETNNKRINSIFFTLIVYQYVPGLNCQPIVEAPPGEKLAKRTKKRVLSVGVISCG